jgi:hypothetical protein
MGMANGSQAAEPAPILIGSNVIVSSVPLAPGVATPYVSTAPIIVNGQLVYLLNRQAPPLPPPGLGSEVSASPLSPGIVSPYISSAPMIVNGYLVYPTNRPTHTLPIHDRTKKGPARLWWDYVRSPQHQAEPEGTWNPVGAGSFWTDFKFAYGSSRQFLGSAESAPVHRQFFNPDLEPGYILRAWHPKKYGYVR